MVNPRYLLIRGTRFNMQQWLIITSADRSYRCHKAVALKFHIDNGSAGTRVLGDPSTQTKRNSHFYRSPETHLMLFKENKSVESHGFFRDPRDMYHYMKMMEVVDG